MYTCERPSTTYFELLIHISCKSVVLTLNTHLLWAATEGLKLSKASDWSFDRSDQKLAESHTPHHQIFPQTFFRYLRTFILVLRTLPFCSPRSINDLEEMEKVLTFRMESIRSTAHFDLMKRNTKIQSHAFGRLGKRRQDSSRESKLKGDRWGTSYYVHRCIRQSTFSYSEPLFVYIYNFSPCSLRRV